MQSKYLINDIFYYFVWGETVAADLITLIDNKVKIKYVVIVGPEEYEAPDFFTSREQYKFFQGYLKFHNIKLIHITSAVMDPAINYRYYVNKETDTISWESYFAHQVISGQVDRDLTPFGHDKTIDKHFISLNGRAHPWRCMFMDHMAKYNLIDNGYVSWHNSEDWQYGYDFKYWKPKIMKFDRRWMNTTDGILDLLYPPEQFKSSLFSVISESNMNCLFVTEKTYIPIFHKRPFIIFGAPNFHKYLASKGYKLFDEVIDYSFDEVDDDQTRCDMMMQQVEKICSYDVYELKALLQKKVEHNFKNMIHRVTNKQDIHTFVSKLLDIDHNMLESYKFSLNIGASEYFKYYLERYNIEI